MQKSSLLPEAKTMGFSDEKIRTPFHKHIDVYNHTVTTFTDLVKRILDPKTQSNELIFKDKCSVTKQ